MKAIRHFFRWVVKVCQYAVVLWDDADWDYAHILKLLKYKLERTRKCIVKNDIIMEVDRVADEIRTAELLIERILHDDYFDHDDYAAHEKKWGPLVFDPYMRHENERTEKDKEECNREFRRMSDAAYAKEVADWAYLWDHFRKHMKSWWD